jgi:hypothetical protein
MADSRIGQYMPLMDNTDITFVYSVVWETEHQGRQYLFLHKVNFPDEVAFPVEVEVVDGVDVYHEVDDIPLWSDLIGLYEATEEQAEGQ